MRCCQRKPFSKFVILFNSLCFSSSLFVCMFFLIFICLYVSSHLYLFLYVGQATIGAQYEVSALFGGSQLSQSAIVSMFCFPQTFFIMITQYIFSSLTKCSKKIARILSLSKFNDSVAAQFETSSFLFNFEILTISP